MRYNEIVKYNYEVELIEYLSFQHHDGITGTHAQFVQACYKMIQSAYN